MKQVVLYHARKHPSLAKVLLIVSGILLVAVLGYILLRPVISSTTLQTLSTSPHELMVRNNAVSYPVLGNDKADALIKGYATKQADAFLATLDENTYDARNRLVLEYTLLHHGKRTAIISFTKQEQRANRPTVVTRHMLTLDVVTAKEIQFADLFKPDVDAAGFLGTLLYDYFKQEHPDDFSPAQFFSLLQFKLDNAHNGWCGDETVTFMINPYDLGSDKDQKTVAINKAILQEILKPEYAAADPGDAIGAQPATFTIATRPKPGDAIDPNQKMLALTFDDGPGQHTARVLDMLKRYRAHGTFFVLGQQVAGRADIVKRMVDEGNEIGNHSWDHASLPTVPQERLQQEIIDTQNAIRAVTGGYTPLLMRPPYGAINPAVVAYLHSQGLKEALWNADTQDWMHQGSTQTVYDAIMSAAGDGRVILLHDIHQASVEATERAIPELISQGYQLVTMSQLERYR